MWDEQDTFGRWVQAIVGFFCAVFVLVLFWTGSFISLWGFPVGCGTVYLAYRCFRYAITGRGNINRDDY